MDYKEKKQMKIFSIICLGQFMSILGSGLSSFGLSVWIFYKTGQATPFALSFLCSILPGIIFSPIAGSLADRRNRKKTIMLTDSLDALLKIVMALLLFSDDMEVWMIYPILFCSSTLSTFQAPAFNASIPMIVSEKNLSRANGMLQLSQAAQNLIAPALAGALFPAIGLNGLLIIDFITYFAGIITIGIANIPQATIKQGEKVGLKIVKEDMRFSWKCINESGFFKFIISFSILNFFANSAMILLGPLVLANYSSTIYGTVQTVYALAMVVGGILSGIMPDCKNKIIRMYSVLILSGIGLIVSGLSENWLSISFGMALFFLFVPYANTLFQTLLQTEIGSDLLGRVGAMVNALLKIASPIACIVSGPLVDYVFNPMMQEDGILGRGILGRLIGNGAGRGIGLLFILCGLFLATVCVCILFNQRKKTNI